MKASITVAPSYFFQYSFHMCTSFNMHLTCEGYIDTITIIKQSTHVAVAKVNKAEGTGESMKSGGANSLKTVIKRLTDEEWRHRFGCWPAKHLSIFTSHVFASHQKPGGGIGNDHESTTLQSLAKTGYRVTWTTKFTNPPGIEIKHERVHGILVHALVLGVEGIHRDRGFCFFQAGMQEELTLENETYIGSNHLWNPQSLREEEEEEEEGEGTRVATSQKMIEPKMPSTEDRVYCWQWNGGKRRRRGGGG